jgi:hypothetical protein
LDLEQFTTRRLTATVFPEELGDMTVIWTSNDNSIVTVDQNGVATAVAKEGTATIIASAGNQGGTCQITVIPKLVESITLEPEELEIKSGETFVFTATVLPENAEDRTVTWTSSNEDVASVSQNGTLTAKEAGEAVITAMAGGKTAECSVVVVAVPIVGDFYFSDGTFSSILEPGKTPIGIVFWSGDATTQDPTLKADHPDCVNGLVVALDGEVQTVWQANADGYHNEISTWIKANTSYNPIKVIVGGGDDDPLINTISGYNNTKAIEAFNAAPGNSAWPVNAISTLADYRTKVPAPESSSGWYLPSTKELSLLITGIVDGNIFERGGIQNGEFINTRLETYIPTAQQLGDDSKRGSYTLYQASQEFSWERLSGIYYGGGGSITPLWYKAYGGPNQSYKGVVRYILAF